MLQLAHQRLRCELGHRCRECLASQFVPAYQSFKGRICQLDDKCIPAQNGNKSRSLQQQTVEIVALGFTLRQLVARERPLCLQRAASIGATKAS